MNDYGYLTYIDRETDYQGTILVSGTTKQSLAQDIELFNQSLSNYYYQYGTFEDKGLEFDKLLYQSDDDGKIPYASSVISTADGEAPTGSSFEFTFTPASGSAYSGGGFSLRTFYPEYQLTISVEDDGEDRSKTFVKSADENTDEFFKMPFENLRRVTFTFTKIPPYSFFQVMGLMIGGVRLFNEADFIEEPQIVEHYSLTGEELEYDTLSFTIRGDKEDFNFIAGEKILWTRNNPLVVWGAPSAFYYKRTFYVESATVNNDGSISVECYDYLANLDNKQFIGILRKNNVLNDSAVWQQLVGSHPLNLGYLVDNQQFSGTLPNDDTRREALRKMLQGNGLTLDRKNGTYYCDCPYRTNPEQFNIYVFDETDICSVPTVEKQAKVSKVHFSRHNYTVDKSNEKEEIFKGQIPTENFKIIFDAPYTSLSYYLVDIDDPDDPTLYSPIILPDPDFVVVARGAYYVTVSTNYGNPIAIKAYPYANYYHDYSRTINVANQYKDNKAVISDCTVCVDNNAGFDLLNWLEYAYGFNTKVTFESLRFVCAGERVTISYDGNVYVGYITAKTDRMNGVYEYEVMCR